MRPCGPPHKALKSRTPAHVSARADTSRLRTGLSRLKPMRAGRTCHVARATQATSSFVFKFMHNILFYAHKRQRYHKTFAKIFLNKKLVPKVPFSLREGPGKRRGADRLCGRGCVPRISVDLLPVGALLCQYPRSLTFWAKDFPGTGKGNTQAAGGPDTRGTQPGAARYCTEVFRGAGRGMA
jgi:hypothetical protein